MKKQESVIMLILTIVLVAVAVYSLLFKLMHSKFDNSYIDMNETEVTYNIYLGGDFYGR